MAGPNNTELPGLEYLRDATMFQMERVNGDDNVHPCKLFKIVSTESVSYCCTIPDCNDLVITDEKYENNRFCINGVGLSIITTYISANKPFGWANRDKAKFDLTDECPKKEWFWKLRVLPKKNQPKDRHVYTVRWVYNDEWLGSIKVENNRMSWDLHIDLPPAQKAILLAQGIHWAVCDHRSLMNVTQPSPSGIDSVLWVDYTEQLTPEEEAIPNNTVEIRGEEFTLRPYLNRSGGFSYSFTLSDVWDNVLMILQYSVGIPGILTGIDINGYTIFKSNGMNGNEAFINVFYGALGKKLGVVRPPFTRDNKGWHLLDHSLADTHPNSTLKTDGKYVDSLYKYTNLLGEVVCTYKSANGNLKMLVQKDMSCKSKIILLSHAVKIACHVSQLHRRQSTPSAVKVDHMRYPMQLVRSVSGMRAHFGSVYAQFVNMQSIFIRVSFKIADEDSIYLHLLNSQSMELIYTVRCEIGAPENYLLPFQAEVVNDKGDLAMFVHQPAIVQTMMVNWKEGTNIGFYEHKQEEGEIKGILQTDDGEQFGTVRRLTKPKLGLYIVNRHNRKIAGIHSPNLNAIQLTFYEQLKCDKIMLIVATAIREAFITFHLENHLPVFPTLAV